VQAWTEAVRAGDDLELETRTAIAKALFDYASTYHDIYASTSDARYQGAAQAMYAGYLAVAGGADADAAKARSAELAALAPKELGAHTEPHVRRLLMARRAELRVCYEAALQANDQLYGEITLTLDYPTAATTPTIATIPPGGAEGMGAVADCMGKAAMMWSLPQKAGRGKTQVTIVASIKPAPRKP
jgi:hypothetical protein